MRVWISALILSLALMGFVMRAHAQCSPANQISPNPNPAGNTTSFITGCNDLNPFDNFGTIISDVWLDNYGTLNNFGSLHGGTGGIINHVGGTLNNFGTAYGGWNAVNEGTLNNEGAWNIWNDFLDNSGLLVNNGTIQILFAGGLTNRGMFLNPGDVIGGNDGGSYVQHAGTAVIDGTMTVLYAEINGGVLQGSGTIVSPVRSDGAPAFPVTINGGTIAPGNSIGTLTIDGPLSFNGGTLLTEIGGIDPGQFDLLKITGLASFLDGTFAFSFIDGFRPHLGDSWEFLTADGGLTGWANILNISFSGLPSSYGFNVTAVNNGLRLNTIAAPVPEAEIYAMMGIGLGFMGWVARRRKLKPAA